MFAAKYLSVSNKKINIERKINRFPNTAGFIIKTNEKQTLT